MGENITMADIEDLEYECTYFNRGRPKEPWEVNAIYPNKYHDREVIRPSSLVYPGIEDSPPPDDDITMKRYIGSGCGLASLITENLLIHPFTVLRRQCQVNPIATKYHLIPITLVPVIIRLHQTQGLNTLWKGVGSILIVRGLTLAVEDLLSKITPWPKEITYNSSLKSFGQHIMLKCVSIGIVTPFYSASLVETVQSEIASEQPGILDVFRDGALRLLEDNSKGRLIPMYALLPPTIFCGVTKYLFTMIVRRVSTQIMHIKHKYSQESQGAYRRDLISEVVVQDIELQSMLISMCAADVVFYPLETVIHRLHLQGTRTIIDNLDTGQTVTPLLTSYSGAIDCYRSILSSEGAFGLYKGFGALMMQFAMHIMVLRGTRWILTELSSLMRSKQRSAKTSQWHQ